jgi:hypothetical protein
MINQTQTSPTKLPMAEPVVNIFFKGNWICKDLADSIKGQIKSRLTILSRKTKLTAKSLCGEEFWKRLEKGERLTAGKYIVYLVEQGELPLIPVQTEHEYPKHYSLG